MLSIGLMVPSASAEIYKYEDEDGVVHLTNVPDGKYDLVLKESWERFHPRISLEKYDPLIWKAAERYSVDYALVKAVIRAESNFNPQAVSRAGAKGLMQLMPGTANALGVNNSFHPEDNIQAGVRHLRYLLDLFKGNLPLTLAAYNAGENAVSRYNGIPPYQETKEYVQRVLRYLENYSKEMKKPPGSD
jgi:soluble lytic murein transglycosylase-like protein